MKYYIFWFIILFTSFEGFGLRTESWGGLGGSSLGWFGLLQLIVLGASLITPFLLKLRFFFDQNRTMGLAAGLLLFLLPLILFQSIFATIISDEVSLTEVFSNFIKMKYMFLYFIFVYLLTRSNGIRIAIKTFLFSAILSVVVEFYIIITGFESAVTKILISNTLGREFRLLLPTSMLMTFAYFYLLTKSKVKFNPLVLGGTLMLFIGVATQMHRTVLIAILLTTIFAFVKLFRFRFKSVINIFLLLVVLLVGIIAISNKSGISLDKIALITTETNKEISDKSGNFGVRFYLPINSLKYVTQNYLILGTGLNWEKMDESDFVSYLNLKYFAAPTYDSGYNNIIVIFGITGVFVFLFLFYRLFKVLNNINKGEYNVQIKNLANSAVFTLLFLMLFGISSDTFILQNASVIFIFIVALTYVIESKTETLCEKSY